MKNQKTENKSEKRVLARLLAEELEVVTGGGCTGVITRGARLDITNRGYDNDGCEY